MTIIEHSPARDEILDFINDSVRQLKASEQEAKYILVGTEAYETLRHAMADRFKREAGYFETYQYIPIVVDPFREDTVCVLPAPEECAKGVHTYRMEQ